jgi:hypothetical protein
MAAPTIATHVPLFCTFSDSLRIPIGAEAKAAFQDACKDIETNGDVFAMSYEGQYDKARAMAADQALPGIDRAGLIALTAIRWCRTFSMVPSTRHLTLEQALAPAETFCDLDEDGLTALGLLRWLERDPQETARSKLAAKYKQLQADSSTLKGLATNPFGVKALLPWLYALAAVAALALDQNQVALKCFQTSVKHLPKATAHLCVHEVLVSIEESSPFLDQLLPKVQQLLEDTLARIQQACQQELPWTEAEGDQAIGLVSAIWRFYEQEANGKLPMAIRREQWRFVPPYKCGVLEGILFLSYFTRLPKDKVSAVRVRTLDEHKKLGNELQCRQIMLLIVQDAIAKRRNFYMPFVERLSSPQQPGWQRWYDREYPEANLALREAGYHVTVRDLFDAWTTADKNVVRATFDDISVFATLLELAEKAA